MTGWSEPATANYLQAGLEKHIAGQLDEAVEEYGHIAPAGPDYPFALNLMGVVAIQKGDYSHAAAQLVCAIALNGHDAEFHSNLGVALKGLGELDEAALCQRRALGIDARSSFAHNQLGQVLEAMGKPEEARQAYREAVCCAPSYVKAWENLAALCRKLEDRAEAEQCEQQIALCDPGDVSARCYLGTTMKKIGRWEESRSYFLRAIESRPHDAVAHNNLGALYHDLGWFDEAAACFVAALNIDPSNCEALNNLGSVRKEQGRVAEAADCYERSLAVQDDDGIRIARALLVPIIPESSTQIAALRGEITQNLTALADRGMTLSDPLAQVGTTTFYLSYHGESNRTLHTTLARIYEQACPELLYNAPHCDQQPPLRAKIKVGFISSFMKRHSIGKTTAGLLAAISRDEFEVHAIFAPPFVDDEYARFILEHATRTTLLGDTLEEARRQISALELDILFYQDIGMDPYTYFLAFARLAPVQCVSFGHPDTTGIRALDYFISSDLFESAGADQHYSEELFLLHNAGTLAYYHRPRVPEAGRRRADFGLSDTSHVYLCPQALFKIHPDFDLILVSILMHDPSGVLVLLETHVPNHARLLRERLERLAPEVCERVIFLPQQESGDFISLIAAADVMLDTLHFNGMNTNLEAFSVGTPVVTMPTLFQRGRHTLGMYRRMGIPDCIAVTPHHYVELALRLAGDHDYREQIKGRILSVCHLLYEDIQVVREFERFFREAVERSDRNRAAQTPWQSCGNC